MSTNVAFLPGNNIRPLIKRSSNNKKNKGNREKKEREKQRAIMYFYSTVTSKELNVVIFTNHVLSTYILHKAKI